MDKKDPLKDKEQMIIIIIINFPDTSSSESQSRAQKFLDNI